MIYGIDRNSGSEKGVWNFLVDRKSIYTKKIHLTSYILHLRRKMEKIFADRLVREIYKTRVRVLSSRPPWKSALSDTQWRRCWFSYSTTSPLVVSSVHGIHKTMWNRARNRPVSKAKRKDLVYLQYSFFMTFIHPIVWCLLVSLGIKRHHSFRIHEDVQIKTDP